ncbi:hypothetical protein CBM2618_A40068 [Cupriavidus taiwanensis]|nr:hypothetical protein CBM2618_A40068 [Cupriavidus taiwanensis]SOZ90687.1 hypothetical protein CBM2621_A40068 [Cupriavidus taiwanensis]
MSPAMVYSYPPEERCNGWRLAQHIARPAAQPPLPSARLGLSSTALADPWSARKRVDLSACFA